MDSVTIENFRCFKNRQTARLAPLTLLVGENSTGKSSFMAMIGILWQSVIFQEFKPNFKNYPFDLGTFSDVIHGNEGEVFSGGFSIGDYKSEIIFRKGNVDPEAYLLSIKNSQTSITLTQSKEEKKVEVKTARGKWVIDPAELRGLESKIETLRIDQRIINIIKILNNDSFKRKNTDFQEKDWIELAELYLKLYEHFDEKHYLWVSSPVQASPLRVYTPGGGRLDPDGEQIPAYLADLSSANDQKWKNIKDSIESFGKETGVFDELNIRQLGDDSDPFQIQVRKNTDEYEGDWRNIMDVGFGVSQLLPFLVHLSRPPDDYILNFQQPEVHLHPSAQAGLGSLLCKAATNRRIIVETHSDFLIKRVRMDIRDQKSNLKPEDVSILYFERINTDEVQIHNISIDEYGNILDQPEKFRAFFTKESNRFLEI